MRGAVRVISMAGAAVVALSLLMGFTPARPEPAAAVVGSQFQAGQIISDAVFYNSGSMSEAQIQAFLEQRVPVCQAGYVCLKDHREDTTSQTAKVEGCAAYTGRTAQSAASILFSVARACGINPQSLIVLLEKEQGLVSDSTPASRQYRSATGYGCPDTADCDANYYGFFNQVYNAAWQFKKYQYRPDGRAYQAGRFNTILWHPNTACGTSQVFIENQATAGLYLYTPYRPNAAALANLYGTGDACSSYGNRNFWRIFNDWFGPTITAGNLVRSLEQPTVYVVVGATKHPIGDLDTFAAYAPLGPLGYVAQSYLDGLATGRKLERLVGDDSGRLYFVDGGGKYHLDTCSRVSDFGYNCPDHVRLTPAQLAALTTRTALTNNISTADGALYHVDDGRKAQAIDDQALQAAGFTEPKSKLTAAAVSHLPHAMPIMRDALYVRQSGSSTYGLWASGALAPVDPSLHATGPLATKLGVKELEGPSFALLPRQARLEPVVSDTSGVQYALTPSGRVRIDGIGLGPSSRLPDSVLAALPVGPERIAEPAALKSPTSNRAYVVSGGAKRPLPEYEDFLAARELMPDPRIITVTSTLVDRLQTGPAWIRPASLVKSPSSDRVYLANGTRLHHVGSPDLLRSLPAWPIRTIPEDLLGGLDASAPFSTFVACSGANWMANGGQRARVADDIRSRFGLAGVAPLALEAATCARIPESAAPLTQLVRAAGDSAVYYVQDGRKRHVVSGAVLSAIGGSTQITVADSTLFSRLPTMSPLVAADPKVVPEFVQVPGDSAVYLVEGPVLRRISTWQDYLFRASTAADPKVYAVTSATLDGFGNGPDYVRPGSLVRTSASPSVYLVDADGERRYVSTMEVPKALGAPPVSITSAATIASLTDGGEASTRLQCGSAPSIGLGGALYPVPTELSADYAGTYAPVAEETCRAMKAPTKPLTRFLRASSGDVYLIELGAKRHVLTLQTLTSLGGSPDKLIDVSDYSLGTFPTGAPIP